MSDSGTRADPRHRRELRLVVASLAASLGIHAAAVALVPPVVTGFAESPTPISVSLRVAPDAPDGQPDERALPDRVEVPVPVVPSEKETALLERPVAAARSKSARISTPARRPAPPPHEPVAAASGSQAPPAADPLPSADQAPSARPPLPASPPPTLARGEHPDTPSVLAVATGPARKVAVAPTTPPRIQANYLSNPPPAYPRRARRDGVEGTVTLRVLVTASGTPGEVKIEASSGSEALDRAALDAVQAWRFVPARRADQAVDAWVRVPVVFRLESG